MILVSIICFIALQDPFDHFNTDKKGIAIEGYDLVSYFSGEPTRGSEDISYQYKGQTFYFISKENKDKFLKNPGRFIPAYGGWCAYAIGDGGDKVRIDPETYKLIDDKLYLFYNFWGTNTLDYWNNDEANLKKKADENWEMIVKIKG